MGLFASPAKSKPPRQRSHIGSVASQVRVKQVVNNLQVLEELGGDFIVRVMRKESEAMITSGESKLPYLLVGMGLGVIAGLLVAPRSGEETRKYLRERSTKGLDTLHQQAGKLRESAEGVVQKGKEIMSRRCCDSVNTGKESKKQV
jgi:gas vesicle protein